MLHVISNRVVDCGDALQWLTALVWRDNLVTYNSLSKQGADLEYRWTVDTNTLSPVSVCVAFCCSCGICLHTLILFVWHIFWFICIICTTVFRDRMNLQFAIWLLPNLAIAMLMEIEATTLKTTSRPNKHSSCLTLQEAEELVIKKCKRSTRGIKNGLPRFRQFFAGCLPCRTFKT